MKIFRLTILLLLLLIIYTCKTESSPNKRINALPIKIKEPTVFDYDTTIWTDIGLLDSTIQIDLKYATTDNFVNQKMYPCGRCFLRPAVAKLILQAQSELQQKGFGLKIYDCYRPKPIQEKLWQKVPNASYVTPPWKGSMHNRGAAIDLTIIDENGMELDMGTPYDFFGKEAHHTYTQHPPNVKGNRQLLKTLMESLDLHPIRTEWWHYSYQKKSYEISEMEWNCKEN